VVDGGTVTLNPPLGKVVYAAAGAADETGLDEVKAGGPVAAWIAGATPPMAYTNLGYQKDGCRAVAAPVQDGGLTYMGMVHVEAGALSQVILFVE
jgi:hypothetical protein